MNRAKNIDEYISGFPLEIREALENVRKTVRKAAPTATETIAYGMPAFKLNGKPLIYFAAYKSHIGFYPLPRAIESFNSELTKYKQGKGSVQFPLDEPMPLELIQRIVEKKLSNSIEEE